MNHVLQHLEGSNVIEKAMGFCDSMPYVSTFILGTWNKEHLKEVLDIFKKQNNNFNRLYYGLLQRKI